MHITKPISWSGHNFHVYPFFNIQGEPTLRKLPDKRIMKTWGNEQKRAWLSDEVNEFIRVFVFTQSSQEMNEFVAAVHELETQERSGYPCRECGETFSTHPSRVEYVNYTIIKICQNRKICAFL